ncbi:CidB/LrgB family autolysis modulator [Paenibacillus lycopersici]|uniref:CidB/LrgB family autolysis modulator n=1 Tax=Paenibacillus lycopersici TaxID=2704462 RepID=A0A6C0G292_9BACL|nr:LrgB family protein [Paenibacillus lycopersici]QHT58775.1 CidB/LrgB family autolysis modulator [Paenibacillus lycopersici]
MLSAVCWLLFTYMVYRGAKRLYRLYPKIYLTPLIITPAVVIAVLESSGVRFDDYDRGAGWLSDMVEPATIALAVTLYRHFGALKRNAFAILAGAGTGAIAAIVSSAGLAWLLGLKPSLIDSLAPRSATTPIAIAVAGSTGGVPTITAVATLVTGILGLVFGPLVVRRFRIENPVARGILFGTSAHSAGISKALEYDAVSGSVACIAMILTAFVTLLATPWLLALLP